MKEICDAKSCTGCGLCAIKCPVNCIEIVENKHGFLTPLINEEECMSCGLCSRVCPALQSIHNKNKIEKVYKCRSVNVTEIMDSTSGGVAYELSKCCVQKHNGIFFGAELFSDLSVHHTFSNNINDIKKYQGSKYIQSYTGNTFEQAKRFLDDGRLVLYIGTPCQISALKNYLEKDYSNLITVDFICHGVGSSKVFRLALEDILGQEYKDKISELKFRNKIHGYKNGTLTLTLTDGTQKEYPSYGNAFGRAFATDLIVRESCIKCKYIGIDRVSDITLSDYTGDDLDEDDKRYGCSFVFINTDKGNAFFGMCKSVFKAEEKTLDYAIQMSYHLTQKSKGNNKREKFFKSLGHIPFSKLKKRYIDINRKNKLENILYKCYRQIRKRRVVKK